MKQKYTFSKYYKMPVKWICVFVSFLNKRVTKGKEKGALNFSMDHEKVDV